MNKTLFLILSVGYLFIAPEICAQKVKWLEGKWEGKGDQPDALLETEWSVSFSYDAATGILKVDYPSLGCGGEWVLVSFDNTSAIFTEKLSYGFEKCMNGGKVVVYMLDNNYRRIYYYHPDDPTLQIAKATVKKQ